MTDERFRAIEAKLQDERRALQRRLDAVEGDRRRKGGGLDPDFAEQAVERENDETLDALDARGREQLQAIEAALERLAAGSFGRCARCGEEIGLERLGAQPTATTCRACAQAEASG